MALRLARRLAATVVATVAVVAPATEALAAWTARGAGTSSARSTYVPSGPTPSVSVDGRNVTVSWPAATLPTGDAVSGYKVGRVASNGTVAAVGAACNTTQTGLSCTETAVPAGTWSYGVTALAGSWSGAEGTRAQAVVGAPTFTITSPVVSSPGTITGTISNFVGLATLTFRLDNATSGALLVGTPAAVVSGGRADVSIVLPPGVADATHTIYAISSAGDVVSATVIVDSTRPTPVTLRTADGGGNSGSVEPGDSVTVAFSEPLRASSLCATWADDGTAKALTTGVTVVVANNGSLLSTDLMTVSVPSCGSAGFHFGTLDLGGKGYVRSGTTATFGATGTSSTITWDPATATLKIVLGTSTTNRYGTVNSSTALYTPDAAITDTHGLAITGTASSTGRQL